MACALVCAASLALTAPAAIAKTGSAAGLSPRLAKLASPSLRDASAARQARALGLAPSGPGSLLRRGRRVLVYLRFDHGAITALPAVRAAGGEVVDSSRRYQTATVAAKPGQLRAIAAVANVASVTEAHAPLTAAAKCPSGEVVSEGVEQLNAGEEAGEARAEFPVDGSGVTVGILSDSFDSAEEAIPGGEVATHALEDEKSGDLPGPNSPCTNKEKVKVFHEIPAFFSEEAFDEGRGMAQIVHDMAPGADISFATAYEGEEAFASNIEELAEEGANVIADDVFYFEEPFFQDGPVAVAAQRATEGGATYFSAAGNDNIFDSEEHEIASWEAPEFRDAGSCPQEVEELEGFNGTHCLDFNPGPGVDKTFGIKVEGHEFLTVDLQWAEPWNGVKTDLDTFLLDASGHLIEEEFSDNIGSQRPDEIMQWFNPSSSTKTVQLVINDYEGKDPRLKFALLQNGGGVEATEYPRSTGEDVVGPTIFGHSGSAAAVSVGAIRFNTTTKPEFYSSRGPVRHDFGPVESAEPAEELGSPEILSKPDLVATDCGSTTFFADFAVIPPEEESRWHFCGTSAAAPHAAGVAALMLDEKPGAEPEEIRAALQASALGVGAFDACAVGSGLIDATGAIEDLLSPSSPTPPECSLPEAGSVEEAQAPGEWGLEAPPTPTPTPEPTPQTVVEPVPKTFFHHKPPHVVRTRTRRAKVVFVFGSNVAGATFACRIDRGLFRPCRKRLVRRYLVGRHTLRVFAVNASGMGDPTPAAYHFRVKRVGR
ncbi:MAG: S8 family serine peptidase [Chloroflexota bacterium]